MINGIVVAKHAQVAKINEEIKDCERKQRALEMAIKQKTNAKLGWSTWFIKLCLWICSLGCYAGNEVHHVARNALVEEQKYEQHVLLALTAVLETASEGTDIWFTLTTLKNLTDQFLYTASVSVLSPTQLQRWGSALVTPQCFWAGVRIPRILHGERRGSHVFAASAPLAT